MQPQQPNSPNPQYDFIMNGRQKPGRNLLPSLNMPKPVKMGLLGAIVLIVLILISALIFNHKSGADSPITELMAQAQEIARVSDVVNQEAQDSTVQTTASTVSAVLNSQEQQLGSYLSGTGEKVDSKALAADQNTNTDAQLQTALQNNNLGSAYNNYLSQSLNSYKANLAKEYSSASSANLRNILNDAAGSIQTILDNL
jgi:hypothetical protein